MQDNNKFIMVHDSNVNQAIPVIYQVKPIIDNAKTMFKVASIINEPVETKKEEKTNNSPIFYI